MAGKGRDDLVFGASSGGVLRIATFRTRVFNPAVAKLRGIDEDGKTTDWPRPTMHDLRHTAASLAGDHLACRVDSPLVTSSAMMEVVIDRTALASDLERARSDFHHLLTLFGDDDWKKATSGTRWTNEELLFHMVFGYMVVQRLLAVVRVFGRMPDCASRRYAWLLDAGTRLFDIINYYGTRLAALVYNRNRMAAKFDRVIKALERSLASEDEDSMSRGMHFPTRWDPYFREHMTLVDVYRYPGQHYDHHRQQLTLTSS